MKRSRVGCIEHFHADYGVRVVSGSIMEWRGRMGHVAFPNNHTQVVDTSAFGGGRRAVAFGGSACGFTCILPELYLSGHMIAIYAQVLQPEIASVDQTIIAFREQSGTRDARMHLYTNGTSLYVAQSDGSEMSRSGWSAGENIAGASRLNYGGDRSVYINGTDTSAPDDDGVPNLNATMLSIGFSGAASGDQEYFGGAIRQVAIFVAPHSQPEAARIALDWMGN